MDVGEIVVHDHGLVLTHWRNVFVNVWTGDATVERLRALRAMREELKRDFPKGMATITVLDTSLHSLSPEAREAAAEIARAFEWHTLGTAHVLEGTGFGAAARRMILSGVLALGRTRSPAKTFDSVRDAAKWVAERAVEPGEREVVAAGVIAHIAEARRALR